MLQDLSTGTPDYLYYEKNILSSTLLQKLGTSGSIPGIKLVSKPSNKGNNNVSIFVIH